MLTPDEAETLLRTQVDAPPDFDQRLHIFDVGFNAHDERTLKILGLTPILNDGQVCLAHNEGFRRWVISHPDRAKAGASAFVMAGFMAQLMRQIPPMRRTALLHELVDEAHSGDHGRPITCSKGCSACCHIQAFITDDEARYILSKYPAEHREISQWKRQAKWKDDPNAYCKHPLHESRCAFLKNNECSIYEFRPATCRNQLSVSDPKLCDTTKPGQQILYASAIRADLLITAAMQVSPSDAMSRQFLKFV